MKYEKHKQILADHTRCNYSGSNCVHANPVAWFDYWKFSLYFRLLLSQMFFSIALFSKNKLKNLYLMTRCLDLKSSCCSKISNRTLQKAIEKIFTRHYSWRKGAFSRRVYMTACIAFKFVYVCFSEIIILSEL